MKAVLHFAFASVNFSDLSTLIVHRVEVFIRFFLEKKIIKVTKCATVVPERLQIHLRVSMDDSSAAVVFMSRGSMLDG